MNGMVVTMVTPFYSWREQLHCIKSLTYSYHCNHCFRFSNKLRFLGYSHLSSKKSVICWIRIH